MSVQVGELPMELRLLVYSAFICLLVWIPYILAEIRQRGLSRAVSYPSGTVEDLPAWAQRAHRAHMNLVENLTPFAALVLVAHFMGVHDQVTLWGAHLFFWSRLVHIVVMWAGIPWVRTAAFTVGVIGNLMILWQILMA